jgi:hypothetical protein
MADDAVAGLDGGNAFADFHDGGSGFVSEQVREELVRSFGALDLIELRAADAAAQDFDQDLAKPERRRLDFLDHEGVLEFDENGGAESHRME